MEKKLFLLVALTGIFNYNDLKAQSRPVAVDDTVIMKKNESVVIDLLANDYDPDGKPIFFVDILQYNIIKDGEKFIIGKLTDGKIQIITNYYYYGNFRLPYLICKKEPKYISDTGFLNLTIVNDPPTVVKYMDINNIKASIEPDGSLFWDRVTNTFTVPKNGDANAIFSAALWIGGMDEGNNLHVAAQTYRQGESFDYQPGPVSNEYDTIFKLKYNKLWKIDKGMIAQHINNWNKPGYQIIPEILSWPAHGDSTKGEATNLAPFVDLNNNRKYEPAIGEYPCIYGDQAIYLIYNDDRTHSVTRVDSFRFEIHAMAYAYASTNQVLNNTIFFKYWIINSSNHTYHNVYVGNWIDFDLGYAYDDYMGCDSILGAFYAYNGSNNDSVYGENPPAVGIVFISDTMSHFMKYNNDWGITGPPSQAIHYYYYLTSRFKNGQKLKYGGNGLSTFWNNREVNYMFPDLPDEPYPAWSEVTSNNQASDRKGVGSIGPFSLGPGESKTIDIAYVWSRKEGFNYIQNLYALLLDMKVAKEWILKNQPQCYSPGASLSENSKNFNIRIYPNPFAERLNVQINDKNHDNIRISVFRSDGKLIASKSTSENNVMIDLSDLSSGIYLIKVESDKINYTQKIQKF